MILFCAIFANCTFRGLAIDKDTFSKKIKVYQELKNKYYTFQMFSIENKDM